MTTPGTRDDARIIPIQTADERQERACLEFHLAELARLRDRGLIAEEAFATAASEATARVDRIARRGLARGEFEAARRLAGQFPRDALEHADRACRTDPEARETWALAIKLHAQLGQDAEALAVCREANARFPGFVPSVETFEAEAAARAARANAPAPFAVEKARAAIQRGEHDAAAALCLERLAIQPDHYDANVMLAFARRRQGRFDEALALYQKLRRIEPSNSAWRHWEDTIRAQAAARPEVVLEPVSAGNGPVERPRAETPPREEAPRLSWSSVTGEFLQDHWQKLILCLAVLLIVVSSNVAASQLLGPKLWSPAGKSLLALVYTVMFAGLGAGLVRWGAERAGRIMLLTTLIVAPADFMLAGQMRLLTAPSGYGLGVLAIDAAALFVLIRLVARALRLGPLVLSLFALSAFNAASPPPGAWAEGWRLALFLAPAGVFLASVVPLVRKSEAGRAEETYLALGLLAFAFVTGTVRTGIFGLDLPPTLYALPVMAGALACIVAWANLDRFDPDPHRKRWLGLAGLALSGLAMALALARPPGVSPLYSGNTLATALLALGLYVAALREERKPAYLYFGFGALIVSYFGAFYFAKDLVHSVEQAASRALGYQHKLPEPFRAINGLVFSPLLAGLSIHFRRAWGDARLARHCHYLGVPFALGACVFSMFEPKAAVICLSGYAVLYAVAVRVFAAPWVAYLATAALTAAAHFGLVAFRPGTTFAEEALGASVLGLGYWSLAALQKVRGGGAAYRRPLDHAALALATLAVLEALLPLAWWPGSVSYATAATLLVVAFTAALVHRDEPSPWLVWAAVAFANLGAALAFLVAGRIALESRYYGTYAMELALLGLLGAALAEGLRRAARDGAVFVPPLIPGATGGSPARASGDVEGTGGQAASGTQSPPALSKEDRSSYPGPLSMASFAPIVLALLLCGLHVAQWEDRLARPDFVLMGLALMFSGLTFTLLMRTYAVVGLAHLAIACGLGVWCCAVQAVRGGVLGEPGAYAACGSAFAVGLIAIEEAARGLVARRAKGIDPDFRSGATPTLDLFCAALPGFEVALVLAASALAIVGLENGPLVIATFAAGAVAILWATRLRKSEALVDLAIVLAIAAAFCLCGWIAGWADLGRGVAWLAVTSAGLALALRFVAGACAAREWLGLYAAPCSRWSAWLTWPAVALAVAGPLLSRASYPIAAAALAVNASALVFAALGRRRAVYTYRAVGSAALAVYVVLFSVGKGSPDTQHVPSLVAVLLAFAVSGLGFACRRRATPEKERIFATPLFRSAVFLTTLGALPVHKSLITMLLASLSYLVMIKGLPTRRWIYATVAVWALAVYFVILDGQAGDRLITAAMVGAYQLWLLGYAVRRLEPALIRRLGLTDRGYDYPLFNSAALACAVAVILRFEQVWGGDHAWFESAGLTLNVAGFLLLMIRPYPHVGWVHASVVVASLGLTMGAAPWIASPAWWVPFAMAQACGWSVAARVLRRYESPICRRLGIVDEAYSEVVALWSRAIFILATLAVLLGVGGGVLAGLEGVAQAAPGGGWWAVLLALGLSGVYLILWRWGGDRVGMTMALEVVFVLAVWWLGVPSSELVARSGMSPRVYLPLATGLIALAGVAGGLARPGRLGSFALRGGLALAVVAAAFTRGEVDPTTVGTLLLATAALGLAAVARGSVAAGYAAALAWGASCAYGALEGTTRLGLPGFGDQSVLVGAALLAAAAVLWALAGRLGRGATASDPATEWPAGSVALAWEQSALLGGLLAAASVGLATTAGPEPVRWVAGLSVGVLFGLALLAIGLIARWGDDRLVYLAQGAILAGYLDFRHAFPIGRGASDALVLTLFGYLDLGLAEIMQRVGLARFAKPTRRFSLVLPVLPLALGVWEAGVEGVRLPYLFMAATFYGMAAASLRSRPLSYASAVLYNAFLWLLWGRIGFAFADRPQFFMIPVGLSTILLAESERESLGREATNALRGLGMAAMYLSLAVPLWQFASLGAWLTLLLVSLAAVFAGIGLRVQVFLWLGLVGFTLDVVYQLGRMGTQDPLAKWAIMLVLGILLVLFVALNETKRIVPTMLKYVEQARRWD